MTYEPGVSTASPTIKVALTYPDGEVMDIFYVSARQPVERRLVVAASIKLSHDVRGLIEQYYDVTDKS
jgi:hypothetical protein